MFRVRLAWTKYEREQTAVDRAFDHIGEDPDSDFLDVSVGKPMYSTFPIGRTVELYPNRALHKRRPLLGAHHAVGVRRA